MSNDTYKLSPWEYFKAIGGIFPTLLVGAFIVWADATDMIEAVDLIDAPDPDDAANWSAQGEWVWGRGGMPLHPAGEASQLFITAYSELYVDHMPVEIKESMYIPEGRKILYSDGSWEETDERDEVSEWIHWDTNEAHIVAITNEAGDWQPVTIV